MICKVLRPYPPVSDRATELDLDYSKYLSSDGPMTSPVIHKNMKRMYSRFT